MNYHCHIRILLCYKNFSKDCHVSHIGLGVTAQYTAKTLTMNGMNAEAKPVFGADDLTLYLKAQQQTKTPITHVVLMAQWIPTQLIALMTREFQDIIFAQNCHSNPAFLCAEPPAINLLRQALDLEMGSTNFIASGNNERLCHAMEQMYGHPMTHLPNLYYMHGSEQIHRPMYNGGTLRIGIFGSLRIYKNMSVAVAAAVEIIQQLQVHGEIWMNSGRTDGASNVVNRTAVAWTKDLPHVTLKELHWTSWPQFRKVIGSMNLHLAPSYTETFCNVVADGLMEGVPSVVSTALEWCPRTWMADVDDTCEVAQVGRRLLYDPHAAADGYRCLKRYVKKGLHEWRRFTGYALDPFVK